MSDLLPCPFCGADAAELHENPHADMAWVACIICGLEAPTETGVQAEQAVDYWNSRPGASSQAEIERLAKALRNIAEGNLGDDPWQANYDKIRTVAVEALSGTPQTASEAFADWLNKGPKLALAAGCHVGIKVTEAKAALSGSKK